MMNLKTKSEKGFSLIEVIIAVAIISLIGTGLFASLGASSKIVLNTDVQETARDLAEAQMEYIQNQPYSGTSNYPVIPDLSVKYPGFSVVIDHSFIDLNGNPSSDDIGLQKIVVTARHGGRDIYILEGHKVNW